MVRQFQRVQRDLPPSVIVCDDMGVAGSVADDLYLKEGSQAGRGDISRSDLVGHAAFEAPIVPRLCHRISQQR